MVISKEMSTPLVTVIIPCYNQGAYLPTAVNSVLQQTYTNWECIIVNDGSTDDTCVIAETFWAQDNRIKVINKKNGGLSSARNTGLAVAKGEFIQLLDSDDYIFPGKIQKQVDDLLVSNGHLSVCDYRKVNFTDKQEISHQYSSPFISDNTLETLIRDWEITLSIPCHCVIFKKSLLQENKIRFNEKLPNHEDWVFWVEIFLQAPIVRKVHEVLCYYYYYETSMSAKRKWMGVGFIKAINFLIRYLNKNGVNNREHFVSLLKEKKEKVNLKYAKYNRSIFTVLHKKVRNRLRLLRTYFDLA